MDADIPTLPAGTSDNSESGTLKRKRRPRHEFSCSYKDKPEEVKRMFDPTGRIQQRPQSQPIPAEQLHPSPVSLDEPLKVENPVTAANPHPPFMSEPPMERDRGSSVVSSEQEVDGLGQVNDHTEGAEFYGPTGTFYFLARLRSRANNSGGTQKQPQQPGQPDSKTSPGGKTLNQTSVVNLLHSSDYSTSPDNRHGHTPGKGTPSASAATRQDSVQYGSGKVLTPADAVFATEVERECVRLYFQNLHNIHPILEQTGFVKRCDEEVWQRKAALEEPSQQRRGARFLSLFNSVIAIGAITAGETSLLMEDHTLQFLDRTELPGENETTYPPIRLARRYFERAKLYLEDICESSSLETAQTLFLMSVFCQNALKPHSCYMYSGMAIRTASAMGIPTNIRSETSQESLLWWSLYSHEIHQGFVSSSSCLINPMVDLAKILMWMTDNLSLHNSHTSLQRLSQTALNLDRELDDWKSGLPRELRFDTSSLEDSEFAMKQKTVLKLRFLNARILLHRQFLILKTPESDRKTLSRHVSSCVKAATETIRFMHTSYLHRPYFRTWWYNCMYLLDACMVLLHVLISNISSPFSNEEVIENLEMSIEIFKAMKMLAVARRCAEIVTELLHVAAAPKTAAAAGGSGGGNAPNQRQTNEHVALQSDPAAVAMKIQDETQQAMQQTTSPMFMTEGLDIHRGGDELGDNLIPGDFDANLVDPNVVWNFLNFEHWNAWSDAAFR
ncbi:putative transcriptional regulatory protein [Colletotrichum sp. SAR11_59]|nr:putative transcriptional regulatory protein [Colletotrichum sp. SAR11_59]